MNAPDERAEGRYLLGGAVGVFLAESLIVPAGLLTAAVLTRKLGPEVYGRFVLATLLVVWVEWTTASVFSRATVKLVSSAADWRPVATTLVRLHLAAGVTAALALCLLAPTAAAFLGDPALSTPLRLLALEVPIFCLAQAHRNVLVGVGAFGARALASGVRWTARLVLISAFLFAGFGLEGAIAGSVAASALELVAARCCVRPRVFGGRGVRLRQLWGNVAPMFLLAVSLQLYDKLDLFALKALGATTAEAGVYGAALNLSLMPGIFALSFAPLLVSSLARSLRDGREDEARGLATQAMRAAVLLLPLPALVAGASAEVVTLAFGADFAQAARPLSLLIVGASATLLLSLATGVMTAHGRLAWTVGAAGPLLAAAPLAYAYAIPRFGMVGAAAAKTCLVALCAVVALCVVRRAWRVASPARTVARSLFVSVAAYAFAALLPAPGPWVVLKLSAGAGAAAAAFFLLGEFRWGGASALARSLLNLRMKTELGGGGEVS